MLLVVGVRWPFQDKDIRERSYSLNTGATEDEALGASSAGRQHRLHFVKPS
jgi:hypothetical protein